MESSIEISKENKIFCDYLCDFDVNNFLIAFALSAEENDYKYFRMREGMVNFNKKDIIVSFGIEVHRTGFFVNNLLSSLSFEETKKFIANIYGL